MPQFLKQHSSCDFYRCRLNERKCFSRLAARNTWDHRFSGLSPSAEQHHSRSDRQDILGKIRKKNPGAPTEYEKLSGKALEHKLKRDDKLRTLISDQDFQLLQKTLNHRLIVSLFVYFISAGLFVFGVFLFYKTVTAPKRCDLSSHRGRRSRAWPSFLLCGGGSGCGIFRHRPTRGIDL